MRIIFNTSFIVNEEIETEWVNFIRQHYIAPLHADQVCKDIIFTKVSIDQPEGKTYSLQLVFQSEEQQAHFVKHHLPVIESKISARYLNQYFYFCSTLTEI